LKSDINNLEDLKKEVRALFDSIDLNKDGIINKDELLKSEFLKAFPHLDEKTANILIEEIDTDEDGSISFDELWVMIESLSAAIVREQHLKIS
jgi:Ca2+-binding EF-hand superfamily protein